ncbi:MAG: helix-hairpin-helix domain-containing protein [Prevotellaceae bacterium]|nr:helix-hairpin-helix domain-containing protein [Prevotellaceae bacterium]MDY5208754.1 helix-hairpin-helix domain-containing protein [Prevotella sp.]
MRVLFILVILLSLALNVNAETEWEKWLDGIMLDGDYSEDTHEELYENLLELQRNGINVNSATREELLALPFLSEQQVMDILEYIHFHGALKSINELMSIESIDYSTRQLLQEFLYAGDKPEKGFPSLKNIMAMGKNELSLYTKIPTYERVGDASNGDYIGYPYKFWARYSFSYAKNVRIGIVASQDAGEPFFSQSNKYGFDQYSGFIQLNGLGSVESLIVGRYSVSAGMGLVMNNSFSLGKTAMLQDFGRQRNALSPHTSASENGYMQGAAATIRLSDAIRITPFFSYRKTDATLNIDGSISSLIYTGYHRTISELNKKNNTSLTAGGMNARWNHKDFSLGATAVFTHINRPLSPNKSATYKKIYPEGSNFFNASLNYSWLHYPFSVNGETAINANGAIATLNTLGWHLSQYVEVMGIYRFYSFNYYSLYANAFSEGGKTQNESGLYLGMRWQPKYGIDIQAYTDLAYFAWPRYGVSQSSYASDNVVSASYKTGNWLLSGKYRLHFKQKDSKSASGISWQTEHRMRIGAEWKDNGWTSRSQLDFTSVSSTSESSSLSQGFMITENIGYDIGKWQIFVGGKYFNTDGYDSRLYSYERALPHTFSFPAYYGHGIRYSFTAVWAPSPTLQFSAKAGITDYFDRSTISSGQQQVNASSACDIEVGMRWRW